ncbi:hypothetical protein BDV98DRAFT_336778 [Pterulicium gracile]|uniref:F-box domain-containing protein n=1 Tax=Pterulicium gracile TaxID=1884261 RepID=A0A5C3Q329_9AGAR|nr:hypothetical protein BDV98DRAFT_336778 [Pterula gracilis]
MDHTSTSEAASIGLNATVTVPPELLAKIFSLVVKSPDLDQITNSEPWMLSQVCNRWREICHASPALWTRSLVCNIIVRRKSAVDDVNKNLF